MSRHTLIQVSDLHLSALRAYNYRGWAACRDHINRVRPDLVVATGDLVLCDPDHDPDHEFVAAELARLDVPWAALPGNHDIGDTGPRPYMGQWVSDARRQRYLDRVGPDWWARDLGRWRIIGLNAQLPESGLAAEAEQFAWLETELQRAAGGTVRRWDVTIVITHFGPSLASADPRYGAQPGTASFCNADDDLLPRADLWLHGHLHCRHDYLVPRAGQRPTRVVCQARGLADKGEADGYEPGKLIEI